MGYLLSTGKIIKAAIAAVAVLGLMLPATALAADLLPDLGMGRLSDFNIDKTKDGRRLLRYSAIVVNVGSGPIEVTGKRASTADPEMSVEQRIYDDTGGSRVVTTAARMFFAGDGHMHWHVRDLETSVLVSLDNGTTVAGAKHGFCFLGNVGYRLTLPGAPQYRVYNGCGQPSDLTVTMGVSVGWGDAYHSTLPDQYIDVTGLPAGRYRLYDTADQQNNFLEQDDSNNITWVDLQLKGGAGAPRIIGYGPAA